MFTLYRIALVPAQKQYRIELLFTHKNGDFGAISVTEGSCAAQISRVHRQILERWIGSVPHLACSRLQDSGAVVQ